MTQNPEAPEPDVDQASTRRAKLLALLLGFITLIVYLPASRYEFNNYDDGQYITKNPWVQNGLHWETIKWAFTSGYASNWHPLTWISHMLDWQLYQASAGGHHLTSILLHSANTMLLFGLLCLMTKAPWRSAFVAAVFAWHPLRVESVAWVAERKDVLCAFFGLLSLIAWVRYVQESKVQSSRSRVSYALALLSFALGLMSKPMLVSLPLILLLLDFWPFHRVADNAKTSWQRCALEKIPFFLLAAISCVITFHFQKSSGAMSMVHEPLPFRLANAINSCAGYLGKIFWPHHLAVIYPYPHQLPTLQVAAAAVLLVGVTIAVCGLARRLPFLMVGWFWFLIMLGPVIGLVQVGEQAMADRYTYLPGIGIAIMVAWGVPALFAGNRSGFRIMAFTSGVVLGACVLATSRQLPYWRNSVALFTRAIQVTGENSVAQCNLGEALATRGDLDDALWHINEALRIRPDYPQAMNNKALILSRRGQNAEAVELLRRVVEEKPDWPDARKNLGQVMLDQGRLEEAMTEFRRVIQLNPGDVQSLTDLGICLAKQGHLDEAIAQYRQALNILPNAFAENALGGALDAQGHINEAAQHYQAAIGLKPDFAEAHNNLGALLNTTGHYDDARKQFEAALEARTNFAEAHYNLGIAFLALGQLTNASAEFSADLALQTNDADAHLNLARICAHERDLAGASNHFSQALTIRPDFVEARNGLALILFQQGDDAAAIDQYRAALRLQPKAADTMRNLAWVLATSANTSLRDGTAALNLVNTANQVAPPATAADFDIGAAACAEAGRFTEAVTAASKALELAQAAGQRELAAAIQSRLERYRAETAFHQSGSGGPVSLP